MMIYVVVVLFLSVQSEICGVGTLVFLKKVAKKYMESSDHGTDHSTASEMQ